MHSMTVFLLRCPGKPYECALGLIQNQNEGLSISAWRVVTSKVEHSGWRLNLCIDDESYKFVRRASFRLNYRFSVVLRPFKPKTATESETVGAGGNCRNHGEGPYGEGWRTRTLHARVLEGLKDLAGGNAEDGDPILWWVHKQTLPR